MDKEIKYQGITADTSDHNASDGDLTIASNLVSDKSGLRPFIAPQPLFRISNGKLLFYHHTANYANYIVVEESVTTSIVSWFHEGNNTYIPIHSFDRPFSSSVVYEVNAVGNTLVILARDGIHYALWKQDNYDYVYLGQKPPELDIRFSIDQYNAALPYDMSQFAQDQRMARYENGSNGNAPNEDEKYYFEVYRMSSVIDSQDDPDDDGQFDVNVVSENGEFIDKYKSELITNIWALVNSVNKTISTKGHFYAPFYVRYCYTLYDGTHYMQSVPIFMPVSSPYQYIVKCHNFDEQMQLTRSGHPNGPDIKIFYESEDGRTQLGHRFYYAKKKMTFSYRPNNCTLKYFLDHLSSDVADELEKWSDIITSVDIFVSPPFVREKADEPIRGLRRYEIQSYSDGAILKKEIDRSWDVANNGRPYSYVDFPLEDEELYIQRLCDVNTFYKVKSFDIKDIVEGIRSHAYNVDIEIAEDVLPILATQEPLSDDYKTHSLLMPVIGQNGLNLTDLYPFNAKLNVSCIREKFHIFPYHAITSVSPWPDAIYRSEYLNIVNGQIEYATVSDIYIKLQTNEGLKYIRTTSPFGNVEVDTGRYVDFKAHLHRILSCPIFYPDSRAKTITFKFIYRFQHASRSNECYITLDMHSSSFLNASYTKPTKLMRIEETFDITDYVSRTAPTHIIGLDTVSYLNKIYTSEIENPFYFPASSINTVGTGTIIGIAAAARALSQGQFGQFPLYAFTTEGLWALSVSSSGGYSTIQPFSRDVCTNRKSITQLDSSVLFTSDRGLMSISGSQVSCISDILQSNRNFNINTEAPYANILRRLSGLSTVPSLFPDISFIDYLKEASIMYIYTRQLILIYRPDKAYAYAYSISNQRWTHIVEPFPIEYNINSYPNAIAVRGGMAYDYAEEQNYTNDTRVPAFILTRPINLDQPNTLKTISTIIQRGDFTNGELQTVLYGSRDLRNWHYISSSNDHKLRGFVGTPYKYYRIALILKLHPDNSLYSVSVQYTPRLTNKPR